MANYFLHVKTFGRGKGSRATKAAAYRAGERIRDERTSAVYNYKANAERMNIQKREYRKRHAEQDSARRWSKFRQQQQSEMKRTQELDPAGQNSAAPGRPKPSPSADEAVNNWLAYRERQRRAESSHGVSQDGPRDPPVEEADRRDTEEAGKDTDRGRDNDAAL